MVPSHSTSIIRLSIPDVADSYQLPDDISTILIRNDGVNDLLFNFDNDPSHYFTLEAGKTMPAPIPIKGGSTIYTDGVGGPTVLEIASWG